MQRGVWEFQSRNEIWWRSALRQPRSASFSLTIQVLMVILWRFFLCNLSHNCVLSTYMHRSRCLMCQASSVAPIGRDFSHALQLLPLLQAFCIAQIGTFLSPSHCSNIAFYDSLNWAVLPRLHGTSIASTIPQIGHSSLDFIASPLLALLTSDVPLSNHELNCFHCFPSFCIAQILDIPF